MFYQLCKLIKPLLGLIKPSQALSRNCPVESFAVNVAIRALTDLFPDQPGLGIVSSQLMEQCFEEKKAGTPQGGEIVDAQVGWWTVGRTYHCDVLLKVLLDRSLVG